MNGDVTIGTRTFDSGAFDNGARTHRADPICTEATDSVQKETGLVKNFGFRRALRKEASLPPTKTSNTLSLSNKELRSMAQQHLQKGNNAKALELSLEALRVDPENTRGQTAFYRIAARACASMGKSSAAGGFYIQAIEQLKEEGEQSEYILGRTLQEYAYFLYREQGYWRALDYARSSLDLLQKHVGKQASAHVRSCHFLNAKIAKRLFLYSSAYQHLIASWNILQTEKREWKHEHQVTLVELAETAACLGQHQAAMKLFRTLIFSILKNRELRPKPLLRALRGLADCELKLNRIEQARQLAIVAELICTDCFGVDSIQALHASVSRTCMELRTGRSVWGIRRLYRIAQRAEDLGGNTTVLAADILDFLADITRAKETSTLRGRIVAQSRAIRLKYALKQGAAAL